jgi:hypothetical protein
VDLAASAVLEANLTRAPPDLIKQRFEPQVMAKLVDLIKCPMDRYAQIELGAPRGGLSSERAVAVAGVPARRPGWRRGGGLGIVGSRGERIASPPSKSCRESRCS